MTLSDFRELPEFSGTEIRAVPWAPGYFATADGRAVSTLVWRGSAWRVLRPHREDRGYLKLNIYLSGRIVRKGVHQLVADAFLDSPDVGQSEVRHLDGNAANNALSNLAWGTPLENSTDTILHGRTAFGERNGMAKITEADVRAIRAACSAGEQQQEVAKRYGLQKMQVSRIVRRERWPHID